MYFKLLLSLLGLSSSQAVAIHSETAPLYSAANAKVIPHQYIIKLKEGVQAEAVQQHLAWVNQLNDVQDTPEFSGDFSLFVLQHKKPGKGIHDTFSYEDIQGYIGTFSKSEVDSLRAAPEIEFIEQDQVVTAYDIENNAPWGLGRISHKQNPGEAGLHHYIYDHDDGVNVTAYVVDTGIKINHVEFEGRAEWGKTIPQGDADEDGNGHGTHVAGTICGKTYGVAKKAKIIAVKVLRSNGSGSMSDVIKGVEWVTIHHKERVKKTSGKEKTRSVANMSLGGGRSKILDAAVNSAVTAGVHFAVAAGNDNRDACDYSPAAAQKAITVGASTIEDSRAWFSNWGSCVDIFAPGHQILSAWIGSKVATNTISGTSMASPHVAGIVTALLSRPEWSDLTPAELKAKLIQTGVRNIIRMGLLPPGHKTKNIFVYSAPHASDDQHEAESYDE